MEDVSRAVTAELRGIKQRQKALLAASSEVGERHQVGQGERRRITRATHAVEIQACRRARRVEQIEDAEVVLRRTVLEDGPEVEGQRVQIARARKRAIGMLDVFIRGGQRPRPGLCIRRREVIGSPSGRGRQGGSRPCCAEDPRSVIAAEACRNGEGLVHILRGADERDRTIVGTRGRGRDSREGLAGTRYVDLTCTLARAT